jgi:hypothetical protein
MLLTWVAPYELDIGEPDWPVEIDSIEVSPDPPQPGKDLTVKVKAKAKERIEVRIPLGHPFFATELAGRRALTLT